MTILQVKNVVVQFNTRAGVIRPVDGVSFDVGHGETLALVGESGSGKSVTALTIMGLLPRRDARLTAGNVLFDGYDLATLDERTMQGLRGNRISMIFQEPMTSLNPLMEVGRQIEESIRLHTGMSRVASRKRAVELLELVRIADPHRRINEYPHRLSGGMRQRVMIAMALACEPKLLIADEPTTALDVTVQAQIMELMTNLQRTLGMSLLLITHDLALVSEVADRVLVMYAGRVAETGGADEILSRPSHPYTSGLLASLPRPRAIAQPRQRLVEISGNVPPLYALPSGCAFVDRCRRAADVCRGERPAERQFGVGRVVACHLAGVET